MSRLPGTLGRPAALCLMLASTPALAHFQEIIPSSDVVPEGGSVTVDMIFTHPFEGGPVMDMKRPVQVGVLKNGTKSDLSGSIAEKPAGDATGWTLAHEVSEPGAAIFYVEPQPYFEPAENKQIVHYAKVIVDGFASGEGWDDLVGLPVEIRPLTRPTGLWTGNQFSGVVLKQGEPVPFAEIEVEFINDGTVKAPNDAFVTQVIKADANGTFSYTMPRGGWWGFAALVDGDQPGKSADGRDVAVEEGGLIWVKTTNMPGSN